MPTIEDLLANQDFRIEVLRSGEVQGKCVLNWISRSQRANDNPAIDTAITIANKLELPVIAVFCIDWSFPDTSSRIWRFMLQGIAELPDALAKRKVGWELVEGDPIDQIALVARRLDAAAIVTDLDPLRTGRKWRRSVAEAVEMPMLVVDSDCVVPAAHFPKEEWAARTIRPKITKLLPKYMRPSENPDAFISSQHRVGEHFLELSQFQRIDMGKGSMLEGGQAAATKRLSTFVESQLESYEENRDHPEIEGTSHLSPYLHFGQISPVRVVLAASSCGASEPAKQAFIDELVVQRELCINFALRNPEYDSWKGLPDWARRTLDRHATDKRERIYRFEELENGQTADPAWNAAQTQLVNEGWMPNRMRMYWAKRLLEWTASPQLAHEFAVALNDRYFLDGRDANGYAGVAWSIGGRHDRPFPPDRPVTGLIRPMTSGGLRRKFDVEAYIRQVEEQHGRL